MVKNDVVERTLSRKTGRRRGKRRGKKAVVKEIPLAQLVLAASYDDSVRYLVPIIKCEEENLERKKMQYLEMDDGFTS